MSRNEKTILNCADRNKTQLAIHIQSTHHGEPLAPMTLCKDLPASLTWKITGTVITGRALTGPWSWSCYNLTSWIFLPIDHALCVAWGPAITLELAVQINRNRHVSYPSPYPSHVVRVGGKGKNVQINKLYLNDWSDPLHTRASLADSAWDKCCSHLRSGMEADVSASPLSPTRIMKTSDPSQLYLSFL